MQPVAVAVAVRMAVLAAVDRHLHFLDRLPEAGPAGEDVGEPRPLFGRQQGAEVGVAEVGIEDGDVAARLAEGERQVAGDDRLALAGRSADHEDRAQPLTAGEQVEVRLQAVERLLQGRRHPDRGADQRRRLAHLRQLRQHRQPVGPFDLLDAGHAPVQVLQPVGGRHRDQEPEDEGEDRVAPRVVVGRRRRGHRRLDPLDPGPAAGLGGDQFQGLDLFFEAEPATRAGALFERRFRRQLGELLAGGGDRPLRFALQLRRLRADEGVGVGVRQLRRSGGARRRRADHDEVAFFDRDRVDAAPERRLGGLGAARLLGFGFEAARDLFADRAGLDQQGEVFDRLFGGTGAE